LTVDVLFGAAGSVVTDGVAPAPGTLVAAVIASCCAPSPLASR
jgi:hypothetical protein